MWLISNKERVEDSGLLEGFCDYHCHLLPGVDDGVRTIGETKEILQLWQTMGMKEVWLTPHVMEDYPNTPADLQEVFQQHFLSLHSPLTIHLAAEHMMDGLFLQRLEEGSLLTLPPLSAHDEGDVHRPSLLLVETSYYIPPMNMGQIIGRIKEKGYQPLLAHPERYQYMTTADYGKWKQQGVMLQLNVPSLVGAYGPEVQHRAEWMLSHDMYDCMGTDTHSMNQASCFVQSLISKKVVKKLLKI